MADVRSHSGVPTIADFGGSFSPTPGTPVVVDTATGDLYAAISGDVVKRVAAIGVGTGLSAAGTTQGTATSLTQAINYISTVTAGSGVILSAGPCQVIYNAGANPVNVYPPSSAAINQIAVNSPMILARFTACSFWFVSSTQWIGSLSA